MPPDSPRPPTSTEAKDGGRGRQGTEETLTHAGPFPGSALPYIFDERYVIENELGRGGMGRVFVARDRKLGRNVAIKIVAPGAHNTDQLHRLEQEARAAGSLNHPNIVSIYDVGTCQGEPYIVSELLQGTTLRKLLRERPLSVREATEYALQFARGLSAAHEQGVIHRDLKPENLFLTENGVVKILDFGIAKLTGPSTATQGSTPSTTEAGTILGTIGYMSPEQVLGQPADHRSDIFSFGAILYEMLCSRRAFEGGSPIQTGMAIVKGKTPELPEHVPVQLARIVRRCLEKDPEKRFQSAAELATELEVFASTLATSPPGASRSPLTRLKRRPVILGALGTLALATAFFIAINYSKHTNPPSFRPLTFQPHAVWSARFSPDGRTIFYSAASEGNPPRIFSTHSTSPESRLLDLPESNLLAVSRAGELAILLRPQFRRFGYRLGTLARVPADGLAAREILDGVQYADWAPGSDAFAVVRNVESRDRLEYPIGTVLYQTTGWISDPRISPRGDWVAFIDHPDPGGDDAGSVVVMDRSGTKRVLASEWSSAQGLAWSPFGEEVWFTAAARGSSIPSAVRAVTLSGRQRLLAQGTGSLRLEDVSRDGQVLVTEPNPQLKLAVLLPGEGTQRDLTWFDQSFVNDLSDDGRTVLFTESGSAGEPDYSVYLRKVDGSPAVRLGTGWGAGISPDGNLVLSIPAEPASLRPLTLLPTRAGIPKPLVIEGITSSNARWFADGKRILVAGTEPNHATRLYVQPLHGGKARAITPEGVENRWFAISPDGKFVAAVDSNRRIVLYPVDGGEPQLIPELAPGDLPIRWGTNRSLYVFRLRELPTTVYRFDFAERRKELWKTITPSPVGAPYVRRITMTPDGRSFAYSYDAGLEMRLYLIEGVK
jgi:serine/threonine protein kinase